MLKKDSDNFPVVTVPIKFLIRISMRPSAKQLNYLRGETGE